MSGRPRRLNNLDCAIAFDYGRLLEETRSKKAGYDELLVALDRAFAQSGVDATTRELLHRCAAAVGLVDRPRFSDGATVLEWIRAVVEEAGAEMVVLPNGDLRFRPQPDPMQQIRYVIGELGGEFQQLALRNFAEGMARVASMPPEPSLSDQIANWRPGLPLPSPLRVSDSLRLATRIVGHEADQVISDEVEIVGRCDVCGMRSYFDDGRICNVLGTCRGIVRPIERAAAASDPQPSAEIHAPAAMRPITAAQRAAEIIEEVNGRACAFCHQRFEPGEHRCPARLGSDPQPSNDPPPHV